MKTRKSQYQPATFIATIPCVERGVCVCVCVCVYVYVDVCVCVCISCNIEYDVEYPSRASDKLLFRSKDSHFEQTRDQEYRIIGSHHPSYSIEYIHHRELIFSKAITPFHISHRN
mgnify:CR=1 FL=1